MFSEQLGILADSNVVGHIFKDILLEGFFPIRKREFVRIFGIG